MRVALIGVGDIPYFNRTSRNFASCAKASPRDSEIPGYLHPSPQIKPPSFVLVMKAVTLIFRSAYSEGLAASTHGESTETKPSTWLCLVQLQSGSTCKHPSSKTDCRRNALLILRFAKAPSSAISMCIGSRVRRVARVPTPQPNPATTMGAPGPGSPRTGLRSWGGGACVRTRDSTPLHQPRPNSAISATSDREPERTGRGHQHSSQNLARAPSQHCKKFRRPGAQ